MSLPLLLLLFTLLSVPVCLNGKGEKGWETQVAPTLGGQARTGFSFSFGEFTFQSRRLDTKCSEHSGLGSSPGLRLCYRDK